MPGRTRHSVEAHGSSPGRVVETATIVRLGKGPGCRCGSTRASWGRRAIGGGFASTNTSGRPLECQEASGRRTRPVPHLRGEGSRVPCSARGIAGVGGTCIHFLLV